MRLPLTHMTSFASCYSQLRSSCLWADPCIYTYVFWTWIRSTADAKNWTNQHNSIHTSRLGGERELPGARFFLFFIAYEKIVYSVFPTSLEVFKWLRWQPLALATTNPACSDGLHGQGNQATTWMQTKGHPQPRDPALSYYQHYHVGN